MKKIALISNAFSLAAFLLLSFQNCSGDMSSLAPKTVLSSNSSSDSPKDPTPEVEPPMNEFPRGFLSSDCLNESSTNACVVFRNPVFQKKSSFSSGLQNSTTLYAQGLQNFAVTLNELDQSGFLKNQYITVDPSALDSNGVSKMQADANGDWKIKYEDDYQAVNQIMSYYWVNELRYYLEQRTDSKLTQDTSFIIDSHHNVQNNAYFSPNSSGKGTIAMGSTTIGGNNHFNSTSADVLVHESCHGFFHYSSNGTVGQSDPNTTSGNNCTSTAGCTRAIHEGQADFCTYMLFPEKAGIGEGFMNSVGGFSERNYSQIKDLSATQIFNSTNGEIHNYGALYAAMWMTIWLDAKSNNKEKDIEKIFTMHLAQLDSRDTFVSALTVIKDIASNQFANENYEQTFQSEWDRKGL